MSEPTEKHKQEAREETPERVWITWDDAYPWETPETGGDQYVRAETIREVLEGLRDDGCYDACFLRWMKRYEDPSGFQHSNACLAARGLWERVKEESDVTE